MLIKLIFRLAALAVVFTPVCFADVTVVVVDKDNKPLSNIIVELVFNQPSDLETLALKSEKTATMQQLDQQFVPHIMAISQGTQVDFPDTDNVMHHVYSFSNAKTFEIDIYKQDVQRNITFEHAGIVELGCNIHDWMLGFIYVAQSPLFTRTQENGKAKLAYKGTADVEVKVWHPRLSPRDAVKTYPVVFDDNGAVVSIKLSEDLLPSFSEFDDVNGVGDYE